MNLPSTAANKGFTLCDVSADDVHDYVRIMRLCLKPYIDEYPGIFGKWDEETVAKDFTDKMGRTFFQKLLLHDETVGFLVYNVQKDVIDGISINLVEKTQNKGIGSAYLKHIIGLSEALGVPIHLYVMRANPAQHLYARFGFEVCDSQEAFIQMKYTPSKEGAGAPDPKEA